MNFNGKKRKDSQTCFCQVFLPLRESEGQLPTTPCPQHVLFFGSPFPYFPHRICHQRPAYAPFPAWGSVGHFHKRSCFAFLSQINQCKHYIKNGQGSMRMHHFFLILHNIRKCLHASAAGLVAIVFIRF